MSASLCSGMTVCLYSHNSERLFETLMHMALHTAKFRAVDVTRFVFSVTLWHSINRALLCSTCNMRNLSGVIIDSGYIGGSSELLGYNKLPCIVSYCCDLSRTCTMAAQETKIKPTHSLDTEEKESLLEKESKIQDPKDQPKQEETKPQYRERQLGAWTLYYPITNAWRDSIPTLNTLYALHGMVKSTPVVWHFLRECLALGPYVFTIYVISSLLASLMPSIQLYNNSYIMELVGILHLFSR